MGNSPENPSPTVDITFNGGARRFAARPGMTVFAACRVNGVYLPTGCGAQGRCGLCRVRVESGEPGGPTEKETARLSADLLADHWRLACQVKVAGDLDLSVPEWALAARSHAVNVEEVEVLTHDIRRLRLRLPADAALPFVPGQFVSFTIKPAGGKPGGTRCYSLASDQEAAATPGGYFDLVIRNVPGGLVSGRVMDAAAGMGVVCTGPFGDFRLRDGDRDIVMIAGGSGLSPFFAMLPALRDDARRRANPRKATLFFGAQSSGDLYRVAEFRAFARENPWFVFVPVVQDGTGDADMEKGLVTEGIDRRAGDLSGAEAYLCGGPGMIRACEAVLSRHGLPAGRVFFDRYC